MKHKIKKYKNTRVTWFILTVYVHGRNTNNTPTVINRLLIQLGDLTYTKSRIRHELMLLN